MKPRHFAFLAVTLSLASGSPARANDSSFGGAGADLVPLAQKNVAMTRENIVLVYAGGVFHVTAEYWFENRGEAPERVQVGFPEYRCPADEGGDCHNQPFQGLVTEVDGKPVKHRQGQLKKEQTWAPYLGTIWLFDVTFAPKKPTHVVHRYSLASDNSVLMDAGTTYVTRTGAVWAGTIGRADFTFLLPPLTHTVSAGFERPRLIEKDGKEWLEVTFSRSDWEPKDDLRIRFTEIALDYPPPPGPAEKRCPGLGLLRSAEQVQACKNLIYAVAGYRFQNADWNSYFYGKESGFRLEAGLDDPATKVWRRALSPVDAFDLNRIDSFSIRRLEEERKLAHLEATTAASVAPPVPTVARSAASSAPSATPSTAPSAAPSPTSTNPEAQKSEGSPPEKTGLCTFDARGRRRGTGVWMAGALLFGGAWVRGARTRSRIHQG